MQFEIYTHVQQLFSYAIQGRVLYWIIVWWKTTVNVLGTNNTYSMGYLDTQVHMNASTFLQDDTKIEIYIYIGEFFWQKSDPTHHILLFLHTYYKINNKHKKTI